MADILFITKQLNDLENSLKGNLEQLPDSDLLQSTLVEIQQLQKDFATKVRLAEDQGRNLNIAIMGQVKAGKSSFLNTLLFQGKPILPEAATPKTANLTRISYAKTPSLVIEYYSPDEWASIQDLAKLGGSDSASRAAIESTKLMDDSAIDVNEILNRGREVIPADSVDELMGKLNDYTGNNGAYTALVKMTHLNLPIEELQGFDIVDTPGMNDPVVSRTLRTEEEMSRSDVVFFLSRCSQFLDESDMNLLSEQLPSKGVKRLSLVGAQFDAALLDVGYDQDSLAKTQASILKSLSPRASAEMGKLIEAIKEYAPERAQLLEGLKQPILASTYAYHFAHFPAEEWQKHKGMNHVYGQLIAMAKNEWDFEWQKEDWVQVANFEPLIAAYTQARQDKDNIVQEQLAALIPDAQQNLHSLAKSFTERIDQRVATLRKNEISDLDTMRKSYQKQIHNVTQKLEDQLGSLIKKAHTMRAEVSQSLKQDQAQFKQLSERTGTEVHERSYEVSTSRWYNPFSWGSSETRYSSYTTEYQYVSAADAAAKVRDYAYECINNIKDAFDDLVNERQLKLDLKKALFDYLQTNTSDFDPQFLRGLLDAEIAKLKLPELNLSYKDVVDGIAQNFQGEVRGQDMDKLRTALNEAVTQVYQRLNAEYEQKTTGVIRTLELVKEKLDQQLTTSLNESLAQVEQEFADKEANIQFYLTCKEPFIPLLKK